MHEFSVFLAVLNECTEWAAAGVYAYITLKEHVTEPHEQIEAEMRAVVKQKIASYAVPDMMQV